MATPATCKSGACSGQTSYSITSKNANLFRVFKRCLNASIYVASGDNLLLINGGLRRNFCHGSMQGFRRVTSPNKSQNMIETRIENVMDPKSFAPDPLYSEISWLRGSFFTVPLFVES